MKKALPPHMYAIVYQTKSPDFDGITERAKYFHVKHEFGGGRTTKGGVSPEAQITLNLKDINTKILIARTGRVVVYYPSNTTLRKALDTLLSCYVPPITRADLRSQGPYDPLSKAFVLETTQNYDGMGNTLSEATVVIHQWLGTKTGEYTFVMPNDEGRIIAPSNPSFQYAGNAAVRIKAIDKDDENGRRIVTGEKLRWKAMLALQQTCRDHKLTPQDLKRAAENPKPREQKGWDEVDLFFEIL